MNTLGRQYSNDLSNLQYYTDIVKQDYETQSEQYKSQQAFDRQKELAQYQAKLELAQNEAAFQQKVKQQAQMTNDPYTAISTVMEQYQKMGVPFNESIQTKVAKAEQFIDNGGTIGEYVDQMIEDIKKKPEYIAATTPEQKMSDYEKMALSHQFDLEKM
jgi:hypothetical protein